MAWTEWANSGNYVQWPLKLLKTQLQYDILLDCLRQFVRELLACETLDPDSMWTLTSHHLCQLGYRGRDVFANSVRTHLSFGATPQSRLERALWTKKRDGGDGTSTDADTDDSICESSGRVSKRKNAAMQNSYLLLPLIKWVIQDQTSWCRWLICL